MIEDRIREIVREEISKAKIPQREDEYLRAEEAAQYLGLKYRDMKALREKLCRMRTQGHPRLKYVQRGEKEFVYKKEHLDQYMEELNKK